MTKTKLKLTRPRALQKCDTIGIVTPSSPMNVKMREKYLLGLENIKALGFQIKEGSLTQSLKEQGYRSGTPQERAHEFMELIRDKGVSAIVSTIGGNNSSSMIPYLDFEEIRANPKIFCGYSDVTSLHMAILAYSGVSTFYGPAVVPSFGEWPKVMPETIDSFLDAVQRHTQGKRELKPPKQWSDHLRKYPSEWNTQERIMKGNKGWRALNRGNVEGEIIVANLNTLCTSAGTSYFPDVDGKILLIEDMAAPLAQEERNLRHLERLGVFEVIKGLIVGKPEFYDQQGAPFDYDDLVLEIVGTHRKYPIVTQFDCGHTNPILTIAECSEVALEALRDFESRVELLAPMVVS